MRLSSSGLGIALRARFRWAVRILRLAQLNHLSQGGHVPVGEIVNEVEAKDPSTVDQERLAPQRDAGRSHTEGSVKAKQRIVQERSPWRDPSLKPHAVQRTGPRAHDQQRGIKSIQTVALPVPGLRLRNAYVGKETEGHPAAGKPVRAQEGQCCQLSCETPP